MFFRAMIRMVVVMRTMVVFMLMPAPSIFVRMGMFVFMFVGMIMFMAVLICVMFMSMFMGMRVLMRVQMFVVFVVCHGILPFDQIISLN